MDMMTDRDMIETLSDHVHQAWMAEKQRQGFADHALALYASPRWRSEMLEKPCAACDLPRDKHHSDMLPYADLPEHIKEYDRATVRAVLAALDAAGQRVVNASTLAKAQEAVALLNSMVLSGESHSERSRAAVREAMG